MVSSMLLSQTKRVSTCLRLSWLALAAFCVIASAQDASAKLPTLFLIGDSTVRNGAGDGANKQWGWGEPIAAYFDPAKVAVLNRARGGRSSRTFLTEGLWDQVLSAMKPGDFVLIQFGHNDGGPINDTSRARGTIKGVGEEAEEIDNLLTKKREVVHSYGWYLRKYIADARAKGATPIICSPIPRKVWKEGRIARDQYARWAEEVAKAEKAPFIDLNEIIARQYEAMGAEKVEPLFADERTHTTLAGAELNAASVISGLKALKPNPLASYLSTKAAGVEAAIVSAGRALYRFKFGAGKTGDTVVPPTTMYSKERGYGFEFGVGGAPAMSGAVTGFKPFFFSVALPEGNYKVTVTFGAFTTYKADLKMFVAEARKRGATPALVTSVNRRNFNEQGKIYSTLGDYPEAVRQVAKEENVALIDMNAMSKSLYEALGPQKSALAFKEGDGTHHNNYGSYELARCVVEGIKANKLDIAKFLANDVKAFDPGRPDPLEYFKIPASPLRSEVKPPGN